MMHFCPQELMVLLAVQDLILPWIGVLLGKLRNKLDMKNTPVGDCGHDESAQH